MKNIFALREGIKYVVVTYDSINLSTNTLPKFLLQVPREAKYENLNLIESAEPNIIWNHLNSHSDFLRLNIPDKVTVLHMYTKS
jgi:hypothetical protein